MTLERFDIRVDPANRAFLAPFLAGLDGREDPWKCDDCGGRGETYRENGLRLCRSCWRDVVSEQYLRSRKLEGETR